MENYPIDFVITWVDGNNQEWMEKRQKYIDVKDKKADTRKRRVRDWDNLKYLFRSIEQCADWVNHIYLLTPGQYPDWLNIDNEKVSVINQDILFPENLIPSFNNCAVELLMYKIPNLSEHFVYFNDDMFILKKVKQEDFFKNGVPLDKVGFAPTQADFDKDGKGGIYGISVMNTRLIAKRFTKQEILHNSKGKFYDLRNGKDLIKTLLMTPWHRITGFNECHTVCSYCKKTFEDLWRHASVDLEDTLNSRFRSEFNVSQWTVRYWQIATGQFEIRNPGFSKYTDIVGIEDAKEAAKYITKRNCKILCINDNVEKESDFESIAKIINNAFESLYPEKSSFEK